MDFSFLGPSAAVVIVVLLFLKFLTSLFDKLVDVLDKLTESNERVAKATEKAAVEAKQRNGHLAELAIENQKSTMTALKDIKSQKVTEQHVDKQVIEKSEVMK